MSHITTSAQINLVSRTVSQNITFTRSDPPAHKIRFGCLMARNITGESATTEMVDCRLSKRTNSMYEGTEKIRPVNVRALAKTQEISGIKSVQNGSCSMMKERST